MDCSAWLHNYSIPNLYLYLPFSSALEKHKQIFFLMLCQVLNALDKFFEGDLRPGAFQKKMQLSLKFFFS